MVPPQVSDYPGLVGAHTVGLADGGPGLPLLGWSTVAGDLRVPHFVGMHALQALPLFVLLLELLAWKLPALQDARRRLRLVLLAPVTFASTLVLLTAQALIGQSIVAPTGNIPTAGIILAVATVTSGIVIMKTPPVSGREPPQPDRIDRSPKGRHDHLKVHSPHHAPQESDEGVQGSHPCLVGRDGFTQTTERKLTPCGNF